MGELPKGDHFIQNKKNPAQRRRSNGETRGKKRSIVTREGKPNGRGAILARKEESNTKRGTQGRKRGKEGSEGRRGAGDSRCE